MQVPPSLLLRKMLRGVVQQSRKFHRSIVNGYSSTAPCHYSSSTISIDRSSLHNPPGNSTLLSSSFPPFFSSSISHFSSFSQNILTNPLPILNSLSTSKGLSRFPSILFFFYNSTYYSVKYNNHTLSLFSTS